jgi:molybdenum cofactor cytidylyltransferase
MSRTSAVILAAGKSLRMGKPKMLLPWEDTTVLGKVVRVFSKGGISDIIVITGGDRELVEDEISRLKNDYPVRSEFNPNYESGEMMSSVLVGLHSVTTESNAAFIGLGDQPQVEEITLEKLLDQRKAGHGIIIPSYNNHRGHPILLDAYYIGKLITSNPHATMREFINVHQQEIVYVDAGPTVLMDLDTPEDYQQYVKNNPL